jgi:hypothetical protein
MSQNRKLGTFGGKMAAITSALTEPLVPETAEYFFDISMVS